jgi:hypothetical protein
MKICKKCKNEVPKSSKICPYCGTKLKMGIVKKIFLSIFAILMLFFIIGIMSPSDTNTTNTTNSTKKTTSDKDLANSSNTKAKPTANKNTSDDSSKVSFNKEKSIFSTKFIESLYDTKMNYLELDSKFFSADRYKLTLNQSDYIYYGDLKNNMPDGKGILLQRVNHAASNNLYAPLYIGYFENGNFNGFGFKYEQASENTIVKNIFSNYLEDFQSVGITYKEYEGYFKDGKFDGKGNLFQIDFGTPLDSVPSTNDTSEDTFKKYFTDNNSEIQKLKNDSYTTNSEFLINKLKPINSILTYSGDFSKDKYSGKGKSYGRNKVIIYDGEFSNDKYDGKGKLYYNNGKLKYDGEFSNNKYNGKGTLYNEDGSIKYSGEWSKGDIK